MERLRLISNICDGMGRGQRDVHTLCLSWKHELLPPFHREQKGTAGGNSPELNLLFIFSVPLFLKKNQLYLICNIASVSGV